MSTDDSPQQPLALQQVSSEDDLINIQKVFAEIIRRPLGKDENMTPDQRGSALIEPSAELTAHERLELYARQYWWRLLGSLADDFKVLRKILGKERFRSLSEAYLTEHKSESFTLRHLGKHFVDFLSANMDLIADVAICLDVAKIEWAQMQVAFAGQSAAVSIEHLQSDPSELTLTLQPTVQLLELSYPAQELFEAKDFMQKDATQELSNTVTRSVSDSASEDSSDYNFPDPQASFLAVHRHNHGIYFKELSEAQYFLLSELASGKSLETSCERTSRAVKDCNLESNLGVWFQEWISLGWFGSLD